MTEVGMLEKLLDRLMLWQKFAVLGVLGGLLVGPPLYLYISNTNTSIQFSVREQGGIAPGRTALKLLQQVQQHRGLSSAFLGANQLGPQRAAKQGEVDKTLDALEQQRAEEDHYAKTLLTKVRKDWTTLANAVATRTLTPQESYDKHTALCITLQAVIEHVADQAGLSLDPDADTYYLMRSVFFDLPAMAEALGETRAKGTNLLAAQHVSNDGQAVMYGLISKDASTAEQMTRTFQKAFDANASLKEMFEGQIAYANRLARDATELARSNVAAVEKATYPVADYIGYFTRAIDAQFVLADATMNQLDRLITERIEQQRNKRNILAGMVALIAAAAWLIAWLMATSILRPVGQALRAARSVAEGDLTSRIDEGGPNETGQMLNAMKRMQENLVRDLRASKALDAVGTNVLIADAEHVIVYQNQALLQSFSEAEADIRRQLPEFTANGLLGASIEVFCESRILQPNLLAALQGTHKTRIKLGTRSFDLVITPVLDKRGVRVGTVIEWVDRTSELAVQEEVAAIVQAAVAGDLSKRVPLEGRYGFFLTLAEGINQLLDVTSRGLEDVAQVLGSLAQGDLTHTIANDYQGTFGQLKQDTNTTVARLRDIVRNIKESTDAINTAAREIAAGNSNLSSRTEQQAASLEETASSMEEITGTVKQNADNARMANQLAIGASDIASRGGEVVGQVVATMNEINDSAKKVVDIISVIDGIAFQTNILALNAAVEAARAGEQGRGFAVVASEVRNLAQRSAAAAKEIKALIGNSVDKVESGTRLVGDAGKTMKEIVGSIQRVTDIMSEISAASVEQSAGIQQVNLTMSQMDENTQKNAALVEEAAAAAESLEEQAHSLSSAVAIFRLEEGALHRLEPVRLRPRQPTKAVNPHAPQPAGRLAMPQPIISHGHHLGSPAADDWEEF
jgi:methyl-accepting chemotaxis protein